MASMVNETDDSNVVTVDACFLAFKIENLDAQWTNRVWSGDCDLLNAGLPDDFEAVHRHTNWASVLTDAANVVRRRRPRSTQRRRSDDDDDHDGDSNNDVEIGEEFWSKLSDSGISFKGITVVACCLVQTGLDPSASYVDREVSVLAARFYLCLVSVPGSNAFRLFNPVFYQQVLLVFGSANDVLKSACEDVARVPSSSRGTHKRRGAAHSSSISDTNHGSRKRRRPAVDDLLDEDSDEDNSNDEESHYDQATAHKQVVILTRHEIQSLVDLLAALSSDVNLFLNSYSLKTCEQSLDMTVQHLGELLLVEARYPNWNLSRLTSQALKVLNSICNPLHGVVDNLVWIVLKNLMQALLCDANKKVASFVVQLAKEVPDAAALPSVRRFLQNICFKASEKADSRNKQCALTFFILDQLPVAAYADVIQWLVSFACSAKVAHRLFILELFSLMLGRAAKQLAADEIHPDKMEFVMQACLMRTVLARCSDKASLVRAKALSVLASTTLSAEPNLHQLVVKMFVTTAKTTNPAKANQARVSERGDETDGDSDEPSSSVGRPATIRANGTLNAVELLRQRTNDPKAHVRRAALHVLQTVVELHADCVTVINVEAIQLHCRDVSLLVRKQAMQSVSDLLQHYPTFNLLQQAWLDGILPMILDPESTVQTKCVESVHDVILQNIVPAAKSSESCHRTAWNILKRIATSRSKDSRDHLRRAVDAISNSGKLKANIVDALKTHVETENKAIAWMMLSTVIPCVAIRNADFVMSYWEQHQIDASDDVLQHVLMVMGEVSHIFDVAKRGSIMGELAALLSEFKHQPVVISEMITTMNLLAKSKDNENSGGEKIFTNCCKTIMKHCDNYLSSIFLQKKGNAAEIDEERAVCYLFTIGELGLHTPAHVPKRIFLLLQSFLAAPSLAGTTNVVDQLDLIPGSQENEGGTNVKEFDRFYCSMVNKRIRRVAFLSLGKLCLQHEMFAKQCVPALGKELESSGDPIIRNNVVVIMADLCKRYTTLVDGYVPSITACLRDPSLMVRRQTLLLLTNLLQEDYLKWKGPLFFHYMSALVDESPQMQALAEYGLRQILHKRYPAMFQQHFVECLFHFNAYKDHEKYNKVILSEKDYQLFSLAGDSLREKRMRLYKFMLENMDDEHRFLVMTKTCQDILGGVLDRSISLTLANQSPSPSGVGLLRDSFAVLCCDDIKLATLRNNVQLDDAEDDLEAVALATAKKTVITQVVKKNAIDNIIPIVVSLKHKLEKLRSPLLKDLMRYLKELMKDYKNEIKEILSGDKLLATEIEYDLKQFDQENRMELEQRKKQRRLSVGVLQATIGATKQITRPASKEEASAENVVKVPIAAPMPVEGPATPASTSQKKTTPTRTLVVQLERVDESLPTGSFVRPMVRSKATPVAASAVPSPRPATPIRPAAAKALRKQLLRAISTPHGVVTDITFHEQQIDGLPFEPLSPILDVVEPTVDDAKKVVLHVQSPERHRCAPKQWAVTTRK